ncbi:MAG: hypothetical protein GX664_06910 [Bacteroidales bacterium]|nr:hypothetical protein [Bacteroidales bacterium]
MNKFFNHFILALMPLMILATSCGAVSQTSSNDNPVLHQKRNNTRSLYETSAYGTVTEKIVAVKVFPYTTFSVIVDSYSTFKGHTTLANAAQYYPQNGVGNNKVTQLEQTWWSCLQEITGCKLIENNSWSGSTICNTGYGGLNATANSFLTRSSQVGDPELILIFGATNDSWANAPLGEYKYKDWTEKELFSYRPALAKMLNGLKAAHPKAKIAFILNSDLKQEIDESTLTICKHYDVQVIELIDIEKTQGHPTIIGMQSIAKQISEALAI